MRIMGQCAGKLQVQRTFQILIGIMIRPVGFGRGFAFKLVCGQEQLLGKGTGIGPVLFTLLRHLLGTQGRNKKANTNGIVRIKPDMRVDRIF